MLKTTGTRGGNWDNSDYAVCIEFFSAVMTFCIVSVVDHNEPTTIVVAALCSVSLLFQVFDTFNYWFQSRYESKITSIATFVAYTATALYRLVLLALHKDVRWFAFATSVDYIVLGVLLFLSYKNIMDQNFPYHSKR